MGIKVKYLFLFSLLLFTELTSVNKLDKRLPTVWRLVFHNAKGHDIVLDCEVAVSDSEKERGLMFREFMGKNEGMIFVYTVSDELRFWMQNTKIPLSIAFISEKLFITGIHEMQPMSTSIVSTDMPVLYAVEANANWFNNNFILRGNRLTIYKNRDDFKIERKNKYKK